MATATATGGMKFFIRVNVINDRHQDLNNRRELIALDRISRVSDLGPNKGTILWLGEDDWVRVTMLFDDFVSKIEELDV